jgi:hypothetical protein
MNPNVHNSLHESGSQNGRSGFEIDPSTTGEDTLRLIAQLRSPDGLEERVHAALRTAPRRGKVLAWPIVFSTNAAWVRATAAAAIVMIVAGGGWGVYSHIQPWQAVKTPAVPARVSSQSGFSGANAVSTPKTLTPPVVSPAPKPVQLNESQKKTHKKPPVAAAAKTNLVAPVVK